MFIERKRVIYTGNNIVFVSNKTVPVKSDKNVWGLSQGNNYTSMN